MEKFNREIENREESTLWNEDIAERVIQERSRRTRRNISVAGSIFIVLLMLVTAGFNMYKSRVTEDSWENYLTSTIRETFETEVVPEEVDDFIEYSFREK